MSPDEIRPCAPDLTERVLERLGLRAPPEPDLRGLDALYRATCHRVPFDSVRKRAHHAAGDPARPLPGATADDFWAHWLRHGTGGTCWASAGAVGSLLAALGFTARRALATMHPGPMSREPNHGTLVVTLDDRAWLVDTSTTTGAPLPLDGAAREGVLGGAAIRRGDAGETLLAWRPLHNPAGILCRIDAVGASEATFAARHAASRGFSLFNHGLHVRVARDGGLDGIALGMRITLDATGAVRARTLDRPARLRALVEDFGFSEEAAAAVPDDEPVPPPPGMDPARWAEVSAGFLAAAPRPTA